MYCQNCGKEISGIESFCPSCGKRVGNSSGYSSNYDQTPKEPATLVPFLLGMFLGVLGVVIAVVVYNGNDGPYTKNPTTHALLWSIIGMVIWIPLILIMIVPFIIAGLQAVVFI